MMYIKPVLNNVLDSRYPSYNDMIERLGFEGYDICPIKNDNNLFVADVYQNGNWIKTGEIEYKNKDVCAYKTLIIIYKSIIK